MGMHSKHGGQTIEGDLHSPGTRRPPLRVAHRDDTLIPRHLRLPWHRRRRERSHGAEPLYAWYRPDRYRAFAGALSDRDTDQLPPMRRGHIPRHGTFPLAIVIAGAPGAEEEVLGALLAKRLGYRHASLVHYLKWHAENSDWFHETPPIDVMIDQLLSEEGGPARLWERVLAGAEDAGTPMAGVIIDGVRRVALSDALSHVVPPEDTVVVYYDVDEDVRQTRLSLTWRRGLSAGSPDSTEVDSRLRQEAVTVVTGDPPRAVTEVIHRLSVDFGPPSKAQRG